MPDFTVVQRGTDSSGRPIYGTRYMWRVWDQILADPDVAPFASEVTITQGAFMARAGGGAVASAGYHDAGGCLDIRTWNLTADQLEAFIRASRRNGFPFWRRDAQHGGMEPHAHGILGTDRPLAYGAAAQWREYIAGGDGLMGNTPDYEWRPSPLVLTPPRRDWFDMATKEDLRQIVREEINRALTREQANGETLRANIRRGGNARDLAKKILEEMKEDDTP